MNHTLHEIYQVLRADAFIEGVETSSLQLVAEILKSLVAILLAAFAQGTAPCEGGGQWVGVGLLSFLPLVVILSK